MICEPVSNLRSRRLFTGYWTAPQDKAIEQSTNQKGMVPGSGAEKTLT
jgi:hypothetical protein